ncbi:hypothetical protein GCM10011428_45170 [Streptomyces violaceus]
MLRAWREFLLPNRFGRREHRSGGLGRSPQQHTPTLAHPYVSHSNTLLHNAHRARTRPRTGTLIR